MSYLVPSDSSGRTADQTRDVMAEIQARNLIEMDREPESVDFLGPLLRRKSIVVILALLGMAIGYLLFIQQSPTYQTTVRIMISNQLPPSVLRGEVSIPAVSLPRQQALITSETVLSNAIEKGKLGQLQTFQGNPFPLGQLKSMFSVKPFGNAADTLELSCRGGNPADLPAVISAVLDAYKQILDEDTLISGQEQTRLIEQLTTQLTQDKKRDEQRYSELVNELRLTADETTGMFINPYFEKLRRIDEERTERERELELTVERLKTCETILKKAEPERSQFIEVLAIDAERYLQLTSSSNANSLAMERQEKISRLQARMEATQDRIRELEIQRTQWGQRYGNSHISMQKLRDEIEGLKLQYSDMEKGVNDLTRLATEDAKGEGGDAKLRATARQKLQEATIRMYLLKLESERSMHESAIASYNREHDELSDEESTNRSKIAELNMLRASIGKTVSSVDEILGRLRATTISSGFTTTRVRQLEQARDGIQVAPKLLNYLAFSLLIGGLIGAGLAILIDRSDLAFRNPYEIFQTMRVPVICKIPNMGKLKVRNELPCSETLVAAIDPRSSAAEAFRACRTAMMFFTNHTGAKTYLISSPSAGDGKSTTVSNLAVSIAQSGKRVCLVDCDLRRPRQHKHFGLDMKPGVADVVEDGVDLDAALRPTFQSNLSILTAGGHPENPGEFVVSAKFSELLQTLRDRFDIILVDSPPLLPVADATQLSTQVDGVLLVFRIRKGVVLASTKARELLELVHAKILGVIVNGVDQNPYYSEYGGYTNSPYTNYAASGYYDKQIKEYAESANGK